MPLLIKSLPPAQTTLEHNMSENLTPNLENAIKICWAYSWRTISSAYIIGSIIAFLWGLAGKALGLPENVILTGATAWGIIVLVVVSVYFVHRLMTAGFGKDKQYKITLVKSSAEHE
ncbi:MAG: hypothetical protein VX468_05695 [Pseudomonadota bacterium]|nr:hypothetical protein [Pseudomonadota bacterium]